MDVYEFVCCQWLGLRSQPSLQYWSNGYAASCVQPSLPLSAPNAMSAYPVILGNLTVTTAVNKLPIPLWTAGLATVGTEFPLPIGHKTLITLQAVAGLLGVWIYRITLHPVAQYPGPKLAACTSLYFMYYIWTGYFPQHCETLFRKHKSNVIRVAPGQLVFNDPRSLKDIVGCSDTY